MRSRPLASERPRNCWRQRRARKDASCCQHRPTWTRSGFRWANIADKLRIKGMGKEYAGLLCEVGVDTVAELQYRNPARLAKSMAEANKKRKLVRFLPSEKLVTRWVEHARKLPRKITY